MNNLLINNGLIIAVLLAGLVVSAVFTIIMRNLVKAAICLGVTSVILSIVMFLMGSWLAAVFELSVCAGLITVLFVSTVSLTKRKTDEEIIIQKKERHKKYVYLPFLLAFIAIVMVVIYPILNINDTWIIKGAISDTSVQDVLWNNRQVDVLGQIIIILAGAFAVSALFKEREKR